MIFSIFLKMTIPILAIFVENIKNHIKVEFMEIQEFTLVIIIVVSLKNDNLGLKMKSLKFFGNQPTYTI